MTALLLMAMVATSFLLGFARDMVIAWRFGGNWLADALFVCLILPVFFENLLGVAVRDGIIAYIKGGRLRASAEISRLQRYLWVTAFLIAMLGWVGAELWLKLLVPGWSASQVDSSLLAFRVASLLIFVQAVLYFQTAILNVGGRFLLPMWRTIVINLAAILAMVLYPSSLLAVVAGMVIGQVLLLIVQQPGLFRSLSVDSQAMDEGRRHGVSSFMFPLVVAALLQQLCVVGEKYFGSLLDEGSIAFLAFGFRIATIPLTIFSLSFLSVIYPALAGLPRIQGGAARGSLVYRAFGICLFVLVPASTVLGAHSALVIATLLQRGAFDAEQTGLTAPLLAIYAAGVPAMGIALLGGRILLARGQGRAFITAAMALTISTLLLDWLLFQKFGAAGVAVAMAIGSWVQAFYTMFAVLAGNACWDVLFLFVRWALAALFSYAMLLLIPIGDSFVWLASACVGSVALHLAAVALMGDRDWLRKDYWSVRSNYRNTERLQA